VLNSSPGAQKGSLHLMSNPSRITMKSQEQRGAGQPNIVELSFASDADANIFGANMALVCSATNVSNDDTISSDYTLPYPAGTDTMVRSAVTDGIGHWQNVRVYDVPAAFAPATRAAALIASGFEMFPNGYTPSTINITVFNPGPSV